MSIDHGFSRKVYVEMASFPIEILLGEVEEVISSLQDIVAEASEAYPDCEELYFMPDGVDIMTHATVLSKRGAVPDTIIETNKADMLAELLKYKTALPEKIYENFMGSIKVIGVKTETSADMRERPQSVEEREAIEQRELALYKRLKEKFENGGNNKHWKVCAVREESTATI